MEKRKMYENAEVYDLQNASSREDIAFYQAMAKKYGGPILELACGSGILSIPIARNGYATTGLDLSERMLDLARIKAKGVENITFVEADMSDFELGKMYKLVFLGFNSICHLFDYRQIEGMLRSINKHLQADGVFILDCFVPLPRYLYRDSNVKYPVFSKNGLKISETNSYDPTEQVNQIKWYYEYEENEWIEDLDMRVYYPQEMQNYLRINGFSIIEKYGSHSQAPLGAKSELQIYVCTKV